MLSAYITIMSKLSARSMQKHDYVLFDAVDPSGQGKAMCCCGVFGFPSLRP